MDSRSPLEIEAIEKLCAVADVDPGNMLLDQSCDVLECARRLKLIRSVRAAMQPRVESTLRP